MQRAFLEETALQCGYCTPGMIMCAVALLRAHPHPDAATIKREMEGHLSRCGVYGRIVRAVQRAARAEAARAGRRTGRPTPGSSGRAAARAGIADWLQIGADGRVTVYSGKVEVGQNVRTSLAQAVADELRLPLEAVRLVLADTGRTPFDAGTFGSRSTPAMAPLLRRVAATAREALIDLAAERWEANRDDLLVSQGRVVHPETGQSLGFGELSGGRPIATPVPECVPLTPAGEWRVAGAPAPKVGGPALVTGAHRYASDVKRPGMRVGKVLRPPAFGARLRALDSAGGGGHPGRAGGAGGGTGSGLVGVVAPDELTAERALLALRARVGRAPAPGRGGTAPPTSEDVFEYFRTHPAEEPVPERFRAGVQQAAGSVPEGLAGSALTLRGRYTAAVHRPRPAGAPGGGGGVGRGRRLDGLDRDAAPLRGAPGAGASSWACRRSGCG